MSKELLARLVQAITGYVAGLLGSQSLDPELSSLLTQGAGIVLAIISYFIAGFLWKSEAPKAPLGSE